MSFKYRYNMIGESGRILKKVVLNASTTFYEGDVVAAGTGGTSGNFAALVGEAIQCTAGSRVLGVIDAIVTVNDVSPSSDGAGNDFTNSYTTAANNETAGKICAIIDTSPFSVFSANADDTLGKTTGSNRPWYFLDMITGTGSQLDESSAGAPSTGTGQFVSHGVDPLDTTRVLVSINESAFNMTGETA